MPGRRKPHSFHGGRAEDDTQEQEVYEIAALSGTSGGAMCILFAWYGLLVNDEDRAAELLDSFRQLELGEQKAEAEPRLLYRKRSFLAQWLNASYSPSCRVEAFCELRLETV